MKTILISVLIILLFSIRSPASDRVWVFFKDKGAAQHLSLRQQELIANASVSKRALHRRQKRAPQSLNRGTFIQDLPVDTTYMNRIKQLGFQVHGVSRWMNAASGWADETIIRQINELPFVKSVQPVRSWIFNREVQENVSPASLSRPVLGDSAVYHYGASAFQIEFHRIQELHNLGLTGKGVVVGMFDTGFRLDHPALGHLKPNILGEYDFVQHDSVTANQPGDAPGQDSHGTLTLSVIGGFRPDTLIGPAFDARYLLAKTEIIDQEIHLEEDNWAFAAEWAEQMGVDIVSSSLGYSIFDAGQSSYNYRDMDGQSTIITRAANELASRGVLVVNSAGNEGASFWRHITAPADGFYVLAVGALTASGEVASFSSRGPTFDGRTKPDVCALGVQVLGASAYGGYYRASGTSLSCPLTAGIAAQILQANPDLSLVQLLDVLRKSGDNTEFPDNNRGWGKVSALKAYYLAVQKPPVKPTGFRVSPPWPNPYSGKGNIISFEVTLPRDQQIILRIFDTLGRQVDTRNYSGSAGLNLIWWNPNGIPGGHLASGIYFYRIQAGAQKTNGKLVVTR